jgi:hypothetical protein
MLDAFRVLEELPIAGSPAGARLHRVPFQFITPARVTFPLSFF